MLRRLIASLVDVRLHIYSYNESGCCAQLDNGAHCGVFAARPASCDDDVGPSRIQEVVGLTYAAFQVQDVGLHLIVTR